MLASDLSFVCSISDEVDVFSEDIKVPPLREGLKAVGPESEISGSLKNFKPEKMGLRTIFNRFIIYYLTAYLVDS